MKKLLAIIILATLTVGFVSAQKYYTRNGHIHFFSSTPVENIEADNKTVTAVFDSESGAIQFSVTMKSFHFEKALMEEHFNENYVESDQYPKSTFKGKIENVSAIDFSKDGVHEVTIKGMLTLHGVTKEITTKATFTIKDGAVTGESQINVKPEDYNIEIPGVVRDKIANEIQVTMTMNFQKK